MSKIYGVSDPIAVTIAKHGLTIESKFIPWSKSRNKNEKMPSLNWEVTLLQNGRKILTTDYSAGCSHCPSYKQGRMTIDTYNAIKNECERGCESSANFSNKGRPILPEDKDVIYSLLLDSEVIEYDFEDWCANFGYEEDSRKAEKIYNECKDIALKFIRIGTKTVEELHEVFQDY